MIWRAGASALLLALPGVRVAADHAAFPSRSKAQAGRRLVSYDQDASHYKRQAHAPHDGGHYLQARQDPAPITVTVTVTESPQCTEDPGVVPVPVPPPGPGPDPNPPPPPGPDPDPNPPPGPDPDPNPPPPPGPDPDPNPPPPPGPDPDPNPPPGPDPDPNPPPPPGPDPDPNPPPGPDPDPNPPPGPDPDPNPPPPPGPDPDPNPPPPPGPDPDPNPPPPPPPPPGPENPEEPEEPEEPECEADLLPGGIVRRSGQHRRAEGDPASCANGVEHVVYATDAGDDVQTGAIGVLLATMVSPTGIKKVDMATGGVLFWRVALTDKQAEKLRAAPGVSFVYKPCSADCYDPTTAIVGRNTALNELIMLGQFPGQSLAWYRSTFLEHEQEGKDVEVYILDGGANLDHDEFTQEVEGNPGSTIKSRAAGGWIQTNPEVDSAEDENGGYNTGHGTRMLAHVAGYTIGPARNIIPRIVRIPTRNPNIEFFLEGLNKIYGDHGSGKKAVLLMSLYWPRFKDDGAPMFVNNQGDDGYDSIRSRMATLISGIAGKGSITITGTGNVGATTINGIPASLGDPRAVDGVPSLLVAGATNAEGTAKWVGTNTDADKKLPHIYAPGENLKSPETASNTEYRPGRGTSIAAARTAGLAAYLLSLQAAGVNFDVGDISTPENLKKYMIDLSWARNDAQPDMKSYYNGIRPTDAGNTDGPSCPIRQRRQVGEDELPDLEDCNPDGDPNAPPDPDAPPDPNAPSGPPTCQETSECPGVMCAGGMQHVECQSGKCVCASPEAPPVISCDADDDCGDITCESTLVKQCRDGKCVCATPEDPPENSCDADDDCGNIECESPKAKQCLDGKCECKEKSCSQASDCDFLTCSENQDKSCSENAQCGCTDRPPPPPAYESGTCTVHIREYANLEGVVPVIDIFDNAGTPIGEWKEGQMQDYDTTVTIPQDKTKLPHEMKFEFLEKWLGADRRRFGTKRDRPPPGQTGLEPNPLRYQTYSVRVTAGGTTWSTEDEDDSRTVLPRCEVGNWDTKSSWNPVEILEEVVDAIFDGASELPTRDMDCRWSC